MPEIIFCQHTSRRHRGRTQSRGNLNSGRTVRVEFTYIVSCIREHDLSILRSGPIKNCRPEENVTERSHPSRNATFVREPLNSR